MRNGLSIEMCRYLCLLENDYSSQSSITWGARCPPRIEWHNLARKREIASFNHDTWLWSNDVLKKGYERKRLCYMVTLQVGLCGKLHPERLVKSILPCQKQTQDMEYFPYANDKKDILLTGRKKAQLFHYGSSAECLIYHPIWLLLFVTSFQLP